MYMFDKLVNLVTGLGGAKDKTVGTSYGLALIPRNELEAAYRSDWLARKIIDIIPYDMTREWRTWQAKGKVITDLENTERRLRVRDKVATALTRARLYGGAAIYVGIKNDRDPTLPLNPERVQKDGLEYLHVLSKHQFATGELDRDPASPFFGEPTYYEIASTSKLDRPRIHPSRVIRFVGSALPDPLEANDVWGDPVLQIVYDAITNASTSQQQIASLLAEAKVDVIKVPGLSELLSTDKGVATMTNRFTHAATMKSMFNMLLLEGTENENEPGEHWDQKQLNFSQFPDLLRLFLQVAAGAADIPVTRLLGQSPAGLNATGESDVRNYYDNCASKQEVELTPNLDRLDDLIIRSALGNRPDDIWYEWNPLWQLSAKEKAEVDKIYADISHVYAQDATIPTEVLEHGIKGRLIENGTFPGIEEAYDDYDAGTLEAIVEEPEEPDVDPNLPVNTNVVPMRGRRVADSRPRTLYVHRPVKNASEILAWARGQGITDLEEASELHVTICYSRAPVDWMEVGTDQAEIVIEEGGPRQVERFGKAVVLLFSDRWLRWRHEELKGHGATHDFPEYQPHVTISYGNEALVLSTIEPYQGKIVLGPEVFRELDENRESA